MHAYRGGSGRSLEEQDESPYTETLSVHVYTVVTKINKQWTALMANKQVEFEQQHA